MPRLLIIVQCLCKKIDACDPIKKKELQEFNIKSAQYIFATTFCGFFKHFFN